MLTQIKKLQRHNRN